MSKTYITTSTRTGSNNDLIGVFTATNDANYGWNISGDSYLSGMTTTYCKTISDCNWNAFIKWAVDDVISYYKLTLTDVIYVDGKIYTSPSNGGGGTKMIINTQKNLTGTVEKRATDMLWHITSPVVKDISYGSSDATPATWIDASGNEQMAVIKANGWGPNDIALDHNLSGGYAEQYVLDSDVDIISQNAGYTVQLRYPKTFPPSPPPLPPEPPVPIPPDGLLPEEEFFDSTMLVGVVTVVVGVLGTLYILNKK